MGGPYNFIHIRRRKIKTEVEQSLTNKIHLYVSNIYSFKTFITD